MVIEIGTRDPNAVKFRPDYLQHSLPFSRMPEQQLVPAEAFYHATSRNCHVNAAVRIGELAVAWRDAIQPVRDLMRGSDALPLALREATKPHSCGQQVA